MTNHPNRSKKSELERYRPTMNLDVLHSWASDAQDQLDLLVAQRDEMLAALKLMYQAWEQLLPNLKHGVVQNCELVCTTAPVAAKAAIANARGE